MEELTKYQEMTLIEVTEVCDNPSIISHIHKDMRALKTTLDDILEEGWIADLEYMEDIPKYTNRIRNSLSKLTKKDRVFLKKIKNIEYENGDGGKACYIVTYK